MLCSLDTDSEVQERQVQIKEMLQVLIQLVVQVEWVNEAEQFGRPLVTVEILAVHHVRVKIVPRSTHSQLGLHP